MTGWPFGMLLITKDVDIFWHPTWIFRITTLHLAESSPRAPATSLQVQCDPLEPVHCEQKCHSDAGAVFHSERDWKHKIRQGQNCNPVFASKVAHASDYLLYPLDCSLTFWRLWEFRIFIVQFINSLCYVSSLYVKVTAGIHKCSIHRYHLEV